MGDATSAVLTARTPVVSALTRLAVLAAAAGWGIAFFGVIDLLVVPLQDERFHAFYLLETGWGALFTFLVAVPLVTFAISPRRWPFALQVLAVAVAVLLPAVVSPARGQVIPAALLGLTAAGAWLGTGYRAAPFRALSWRRANRVLVALAAVAVVAAAGYAWDLLRLARSGQPDEVTWGLMHLPMQASFALALAGCAVVAVLARGAHGSRGSALLPAVAAAWFGVVSVLYPDVVGSAGRAGGIACVVWALVFTTVALSTTAEETRRGDG